MTARRATGRPSARGRAKRRRGRRGGGWGTAFRWLARVVRELRALRPSPATDPARPVTGGRAGSPGAARTFDQFRASRPDLFPTAHPNQLDDQTTRHPSTDPSTDPVSDERTVR